MRIATSAASRLHDRVRGRRGTNPFNNPATQSVTRISKQLQQTAYHEAGHAVIARVLTLDCGGATIEPNYEEETAGYAITGNLDKCLYEWERRGKARSWDAVCRGRIISVMAGAVAEMELLGAKPCGDVDDRIWIEEMARELSRESSDWERLEPRLRKMTQRLVRRHRRRIERVAKALIKQRTLSREELDGLVGHSVEDVRPNSPFLLAMYSRNE